MGQVLKTFLFAVFVGAVGLSQTAHGQSNRAQQEQAAERARQAQAAAAAARDRDREAQARRAAAEKAATTSGRQQVPAANDTRKSSNYPSTVPTERLRFESKPRPSGGLSQPASKPAPSGTTFSSNGVGKLARSPTAAEARRGFTGRITDDGRALVKFQGRIYVVPASRIGVVPRREAGSNTSLPTRWSAQKQASIATAIQALSGAPPGSVGTGGGGATGSGGGKLSTAFKVAASDNSKVFTVYSPQTAARILAAQAKKSSPNAWKIGIGADRVAHILFGDITVDSSRKQGGGHIFGLAEGGKTEFPKTWSEQKIVNAALRIANTSEGIPDRGRFAHYGSEDGFEMKVVVEKDGEWIWTAYPKGKDPSR